MAAMRVLVAAAALLLLATAGSCYDLANVISPRHASILSGEWGQYQAVVQPHQRLLTSLTAGS